MTQKVLQRLSYMFSYTSEDIIRKKKITIVSLEEHSSAWNILN